MNGKLFGALLNAQREMGKLTPDSTNPHLRNKYASLAAVLDTVRGPLHNNGLVLYQSATSNQDEHGTVVVVMSTLAHPESGEVLQELLPMPLSKVTSQEIGSAITYGRRYLAMAMCGLAPDDDDGNEASKQVRPAQAQHRAPVQRQPPPPPDDAPPFDLADLPELNPDSAHTLDAYTGLFADADVQFSQQAVEYIRQARQWDKDSGQAKMSNKVAEGKKVSQYGFLVSQIDKVVGDKMHGPVLSAILGRVVDHDHLPGVKVKGMLDDLMSKDEDYLRTVKDIIGEVAAKCRQGVKA
jgi:hypothetical protein